MIQHSYLKMNNKQKEYLIGLMNHDLSIRNRFEFKMDLQINKQEVINLLDRIDEVKK